MKSRSTIFLFITFLATGINAVGQDAGSLSILSIKTPEEAKKLAKLDIQHQSISLFVQGGFAPIVNKSDNEFEKKYKLTIRDFGCTALDNKIVSTYNHEIFRHLKSKYGEKWVDEVRKDIIGLREYKLRKTAIE